MGLGWDAGLRDLADGVRALPQGRLRACREIVGMPDKAPVATKLWSDCDYRD